MKPTPLRSPILRPVLAGSVTLVLTAFRLLGGAPPGPGADAADRPTPRTDENSRLAHAQLVEKARKGGIDVYFVGDSITRRWGATDYPDFLAHWSRSFFGWNAANFGWGADRIQNILWRLENGELEGVHPKVIVIQAGTNNLGRQSPDDATVGDLTRGLEALVNLCRAKAPQATIILTGLFPRDDVPGLMPSIRRINTRLAQLADGRRVRWLDVNDRLAGPDGRLLDGMMADGLHPSLKGYQVWAEGLKPLFTELLGPPGPTDHAPPPTGDPSAARRSRPAPPPAGTGGR